MNEGEAFSCAHYHRWADPSKDAKAPQPWRPLAQHGQAPPNCGHLYSFLGPRIDSCGRLACLGVHPSVSACVCSVSVVLKVAVARLLLDSGCFVKRVVVGTLGVLVSVLVKYVRMAGMCSFGAAQRGWPAVPAPPGCRVHIPDCGWAAVPVSPVSPSSRVNHGLACAAACACAPPPPPTPL